MPTIRPLVMMARGASGFDGRVRADARNWTMRGLVLIHDFEVPFDEQVLHPVLTDLTGFAVGDQFVGVECDVEIEIILDHDLHGPGLGDLAAVLLDRFAGEPACRTVAVTVDTAHRAQFFEEFGRHDLVVFFRNVAQRIFQGDRCVVAIEAKPRLGARRIPASKLLGSGSSVSSICVNPLMCTSTRRHCNPFSQKSNTERWSQ